MPEGKFKLAPFEYVPAAQERVHMPAQTAEVLQTLQSMHVILAVLEYVPAWQVAHAAVPACAENLPASQSVHVCAPLVALYLPATQAEHVPRSGPV